MVVWCTQNVRRDGSSFMWHQPCQRCNYITSLDIQKTRHKKLFTHAESHASAVSLLESGEERYVKAINYNNHNNLSHDKSRELDPPLLVLLHWRAGLCGSRELRDVQRQVRDDGVGELPLKAVVPHPVHGHQDHVFRRGGRVNLFFGRGLQRHGLCQTGRSNRCSR